MSEPEELLKLIDARMEAFKNNDDSHDRDLFYYGGMSNIRWLVYDFFNAPRPIKEPKPLTDEELKMLTEDE